MSTSFSTFGTVPLAVDTKRQLLLRQLAASQAAQPAPLPAFDPVRTDTMRQLRFKLVKSLKRARGD